MSHLSCHRECSNIDKDGEQHNKPHIPFTSFLLSAQFSVLFHLYPTHFSPTFCFDAYHRLHNILSVNILLCILKEKDFLMNRIYFRALLGSQWNGVKEQSSHILCLAHTASTTVSVPAPEWYICILYEPTLTQHYHPKSIVYYRVRSWSVHSVGFDKCGDIYLAL